MARWRHCQIQVDTKRRIATVARPLLTRADARRAVTARAFSHARRLSEATGMATASNALYGVDVYSDSSEDSGNWESAGPRLSIGKRVDVSAPRKATENDLDAASVSSSDSEDDAMLVALVSAIACGADRPRVFDPYDPSRPDDSSGMARRGEACDSADDATDATAEDDDDEHSASSCSASSESEEVEETRPRRACFRTNPAPARTRTGSLGAIEVAFAATRPSPGGGRWGPPPRRGSHSRPGTAKASANAFAGPIPTVRAAVARAMAGALERKAAEAERALSSHSLSDARDGSARAEKKAAVAAAAALDSRAEWARRQAIGYELEGARARGAYASPEKADHFSSRRRRAPSSAFAKAARTSPFDSVTDFFVSGRRPEARARDRFSKSDLFRAPRLEPRTAPRTAQWKKPSVPRGRKPARAAGTKDESSSDESEADAWWTAPFGAVAAKKVRVLDDVSERKKRAKARLRSPGVPPGDLGVAIDRTRPRPSGARGVTKWAKPKPAVPRGSNRSETGARLGAEDSFSGDSASWWDGIGVAKALRRRASATTTYGHTDSPDRAPRDPARDPTRPRVAGPFAWSPPPADVVSKKQSGRRPGSAADGRSTSNAFSSPSLSRPRAFRTLFSSPAIPSDALSRKRAPRVAFRPLAAGKRGRRAVSRRLAERARRRKATRDEKGADENPGEDEKGADEKGLTLSPGPGAYDAAAAFAATRPSAASAPPFAPRSRPAEIRVAKRRDKVHTADEVPLDLSAERWRVAAGSRARNAFPFVSFARAPPRVTADEALFREALARNAEPTSSEQTSRRDARRAIAAYEFGDARVLDPLARKLASGEIVAPPEPSRTCVEASVKRTPVFFKPTVFVPDASSRGFDARRETEDELADPLAAWRAAVAPAVKRVPSFVKPYVKPDVLAEKEQDRLARARGPSRAHGAADAAARGRALGGGGALPLRYYLGRDEDYASRVKAREVEEESAKAISYEPGETGVGDAPVVASLRVAEALDALRASTPATVFGLAAERWAERARREKDIEKDIERRVVARRASRAFAGETYVASKAARLLDDDESFVHSRNGNDETNDVTKTVRETFDRFARARDAIARSHPASGAAWLGMEAARAAAAATRPSAPGWTMLPLEVTKPRIGAGRVVKPGDRPALDVRVSLVRAKGFLETAGTSTDMARAAGREEKKKYSGDAAGARRGPAAYRAERADALRSRRAPAAVFGTAPRLEPSSGEKTGTEKKEPADRTEAEMHLSHRDQDLARVSLDRATRLSRGVGVDMRRDSNPRFDAETRRLQTEARRVLAARRLEKLVGEGGEARGSSKGRKGIRAPENATKRERDLFFDPTAATRARVPAADFASLTWRVSENARGRVEMELLEAEIGPGRYEPRDDAKAGRRRAPEADFASAAARWFSEERKETNPEETNPPNPSETSDVAAAFAAVRPRVAVGGVIPDAGRGIGVSDGNDGNDASQKPLPPSAVVNLEDALRYLRGERHASAPDFKRAARSGREASPRRNAEDARAFADVSASAAAAAGGARGTARGANVPAFGVPEPLVPKKPADWKSRDPEAFAEGDVLFLLPDLARDSARSARFDNASDFAKTLGREMVAALVPDAALTAHVDYLSDRALSSKAGRLDIGTGAVDISRGRDPNAARPGGDDASSYADLDAGVYLPPRTGPGLLRSSFLLTGQRAAPSPVDLAREAGRSVFQKKDVGDTLALDAAAAADAARPRQGVGASAFSRAPRRVGAAGAAADSSRFPHGDALVLHPEHADARDAASASVSLGRAFDFGRAAGRDPDPRARWGEDDVIHALRAEPPTASTLDASLAKVHAAGVDGRTLAAARRMERRARLEARMPRRAPGEDAPSRERTDGPVR